MACTRGSRSGEPTRSQAALLPTIALRVAYRCVRSAAGPPSGVSLWSDRRLQGDELKDADVATGSGVPVRAARKQSPAPLTASRLVCGCCTSDSCRPGAAKRRAQRPLGGSEREYAHGRPPTVTAATQSPIAHIHPECGQACWGHRSPGFSARSFAECQQERGAPEPDVQLAFLAVAFTTHAADGVATASKMAIASAANPAKALPHPSSDEVTGTKPSHLT